MHHRHRRRSAPDVGGEAVPLPPAQHAHHVRGARHDGLRGAGGDGRAPGAAAGDGVGHLGGWWLPDEHGRDGDDGAGGAARKAGGVQQWVPRHGAAMAAVLPREALLLYADLEPRLREARQRIRHSRVPGAGREHAGRSGRPGERGSWTGAGGVRHRAGGKRVSNDPTGGLAIGADRGGGVTTAIAVDVLLDGTLLTLNRAVGVLRRRNVAVEGLALRPSADGGTSRMTFVLHTDAATADRVVQQFRKIVGVRAVEVTTAQDPKGAAMSSSTVRVFYDADA